AKKVTSPPRISLPTVEPRWVILKNRSIAPTDFSGACDEVVIAGILAESTHVASNFDRWLRSFCDRPPPQPPGAQARAGERQGIVPGRHHRMAGRVAQSARGIPGRPVPGPPVGAGVRGRDRAGCDRVLVGACGAPGGR